MGSPEEKGSSLTERVAGLALFLVSFGFYLFQAAPSITAGDAGEFMTAAGTLSLPHAPSFPLYILSGRIFLELLPFASIPFRLNVFSCFTSSLTLVITYFIGRRLKAPLWLSLVVSAMIGTASSFWANSLVTEVFSLNIFIASILTLCLVRIGQSTNVGSLSRGIILFGFLLGLGLGNHHILVFMFTGFLFLILFIKKDRFLIKTIFLTLIFGALGFSIYTTLPIRSARKPPLNWGQPTTFEKLKRTILRQDYGSFQLALGESPDRNLENTNRHIKQFGIQLNREMSLPILVFICVGLAVGFWRREKFFGVALIIFFFSGPFFCWLGNLPFNAQSSGIIGRFYILPTFFLMLGLFSNVRYLSLLLPLLLVLNIKNGWAHGVNHRSGRLVYDYGRAMMRSLSPDSVLLMDGGDDAFYSTAMLRYVQGVRSDVQLHDRGGLVFKNLYGNDFRSLSKAQKQARRQEVEYQLLDQRPLFYSTMDENALSGAPLVPKGFLYEANGHEAEGISWPLICLRSLYPLYPNDYRTRALGAFFPFMEGKKELQENNFDEALRFFRRAQQIGFDVDWLRVNLGVEYAKWGYDSLMKGRLELSDWIYRQWLELDPNNMQAHCNLGVLLEKMGRESDAKEQYKKAADLFPEAADPVYNLAVLAWKEEDWMTVIKYLKEVLRRQPQHAQARLYMDQARQKLGLAE